MPDKEKKATEEEKQKLLTSLREAASAIDKNYGATVFHGIKGMVGIGFRHIKKRVRMHAAGKAAEDEAKATFRSGERRSWNEFKASNSEITNDAVVLLNSLAVLDHSLIALADIPLLHNTDGSRRITDLHNELPFARSRIMHCADGYNAIVTNVGQTIRQDQADQPIDSEEIFVAMAGFEGRIKTNMTEVATLLANSRVKLIEIADLQRYKVVATAKGFKVGDKSFTDGDITRSIGIVKDVVGNLQAGAELTAIVVPEETVSQVFDAVTGVGQILINFGSTLAEDWDVKRRARKIMNNKEYREAADEFLKNNPKEVHKYLKDEAIKQLSRALDLTAPAVSAVLAGLSAALDLSGAGAIVAKAVFPWVFPTVKTSIVTVFESIEEARITAAFPENAPAVEDMSVAVATYKGSIQDLMADSEGIAAKAMSEIAGEPSEASNARKTIFDELKGKLREKLRKGLGNLTPDGLLEAVSDLIKPVVTKILETVDTTPPPTYDDAALLGRVRELAKGTGVEFKYAV